MSPELKSTSTSASFISSVLSLDERSTSRSVGWVVVVVVGGRAAVVAAGGGLAGLGSRLGSFYWLLI